MKPLFILILTVFLAIIGGGHWLVYRTLLHLWPIANAALLLAVRISFVVLSASFLLTSVVTNARYTRLGSYLYAASAIWLGTLYWLFFASVAIALVALVARVIPSIPTLWIGRALFVIALATSAYGLIHSYGLKVTRYDASLPNLPSAWEGKTVALVADVHLGNVRGTRFAERVAKRLSAERPDAVLIAGDFYDGPAIPFAEATEPFRLVAAPKGMYFANGNHEEYSENSKYVNALKGVGVRVLNDEFVDVDGLQIVGVNYSTANTDEKVARTLATIPFDPSRPTILIKHVPNGLEPVAAAGVDLQVSGHTHGGQVWPGAWLTNKVYKGFAYGHRPYKSLQVITTSGAGTWGPPQRVGTDPEIVLVTLRKAP